nr:MAG TPA: hypothetical protein [Caudoviricetes sp.]
MTAKHDTRLYQSQYSKKILMLLIVNIRIFF